MKLILVLMVLVLPCQSFARDHKLFDRFNNEIQENMQAEDSFGVNDNFVDLITELPQSKDQASYQKKNKRGRAPASVPGLEVDPGKLEEW